MPEKAPLIYVTVVDPDPLAAAGLRAVFEHTPGMKVDNDVDLHKRRSVAEDSAHVAVVSVAHRGRPALTTIRELVEARVAVLALTLDEDHDRHDDHVLLAMLREGARGHCAKSASPDDLVDAVRKLGAGRPALSDRQAQLLLQEWLLTNHGAEREAARRSIRRLTAREREVVRAVARGLTNSQVAAELHCAPATAKAHLASIFTRLGLTNRVELAVLGLRAGLLDHD